MKIIDQELNAAGQRFELPCDAPWQRPLVTFHNA